MRILVTNDDGLFSEGIRALADALRTRHEVWVVAPESNRSGVSHGITMYDRLSFKNAGEREFSCTGLPADCAMTGINGLLPELPDVVISGINHGANIGTDIVYSGTAAAARQAAFAGIPGIAVSLVSDCDDADRSECALSPFDPLARFILENIDALVSLCERDVFVNVNAPSLPAYRGARLTGIARREYRDTIALHAEADGTLKRSFESSEILTDGDDDSDWNTVREGFVSVSRVRAQPVSAGAPAGGMPGFLV